jgi:hypothetical protein
MSESNNPDMGREPQGRSNRPLLRSFRRPSSIVLALVVLVVVVAGYIIVSRSHATAAPVLWGDSYGGSSVANIQSATAQWNNTTVGRYYFSGDPVVYSNSNLTAIPARETIFVSFKTAVSTVKSGAYDATFRTILQSWNNSGREIYWTWQHEADDPTKNIAPADFVQGYNHLLAVARANPSPKVHSMSIFMAIMLTSSHPHGNPESWYVDTDVLGFDCYFLTTETLASPPMSLPRCGITRALTS